MGICPFVLSLACLASLSCFALEQPQNSRKMEPVSVTTLADAAPELRAKAEEDLTEFFGHRNGDLQTASILDEDTILIMDYGTRQEDGYEVETILYIDQTRASSGRVGGSSAHRYYRSGVNLFTVHAYSYFTYDGTSVSPDLMNHECWCTSNTANFTISKTDYDPKTLGPKSTRYYIYDITATGISVDDRTISITCDKNGNVTIEDKTFQY